MDHLKGVICIMQRHPLDTFNEVFPPCASHLQLLLFVYVCRKKSIGWKCCRLMNSKERLTRRWHCLKRRERSAKPCLIASVHALWGALSTCAMPNERMYLWSPWAWSSHFFLCHFYFVLKVKGSLMVGPAGSEILDTSDPYSSPGSCCTFDSSHFLIVKAQNTAVCYTQHDKIE